MKKMLLTIVLLLSSLLLVSCNKTETIYMFEIDEAYNEYLTMGTSADYPPYEWPLKVNNKQTLVGIDIELAKEIAKESKKNLRIISKGFDLLLEDLVSGKVDFVISGMNPNSDREKVVDFSVSYYEAYHAVMVHKDNKAKYDSIDALNVKNIKVGAQTGTVQQDIVNELFANSAKHFVQGVPDLVMQLNDKSIAALVVEGPVAAVYAEKFPNLVVQDFKVGATEAGTAVAVPKNNPAMLTLVNKVINDLKTSGKMTEIITDAVALSAAPEEVSFWYWAEILLKGLLMTLILALLSVLFGSVIALGIAFMRLSDKKIMRGIAKTYVEVIRGTPLLVQVLLIYSFIKIPVTIFIGIDISTFIPGMLALLINSSAYVSEIIRGGIQSVDVGQKEAAESLGMNNKQVMNKIILPQAVKNIIPSLGNEFVTMIKETSIFMYLGVAELMYAAQMVKFGTYAVKEVYIIVALLYLVLTLSTSKLMSMLERKLRKNDEK